MADGDTQQEQSGHQVILPTKVRVTDTIEDVQAVEVQFVFEPGPSAPRVYKKHLTLADFSDDGSGNGTALVYAVPEGDIILNGAIFVTEAFDDSSAADVQAGAIDAASIAAGFFYTGTTADGLQTQIVANQLNDGGADWVDRAVALAGGIPYGAYIQGWGNDGTTGECDVYVVVATAVAL